MHIVSDSQSYISLLQPPNVYLGHFLNLMSELQSYGLLQWMAAVLGTDPAHLPCAEDSATA